MSQEVKVEVVKVPHIIKIGLVREHKKIRRISIFHKTDSINFHAGVMNY